MAFNPPVVDNFTGSNGSMDNRVSSTGPIWAAPVITIDTAAAITSNAVSPTLINTDYSAIIDSQQYGPDLQIACTITTLAAGSNIALTALSNGYTTFPETYGDGNLYHLQIFTGGGGSAGEYIISRDIGTNALEILDFVSVSGDMTAPESIGFSIVEEATGTRLTVWRKLAGVWTEETNVLDTNVARPFGQRYVGFFVRRTTAAVPVMDDFMVQTTAGAAMPVAWYGAAG